MTRRWILLALIALIVLPQVPVNAQQPVQLDVERFVKIGPAYMWIKDVFRPSSPITSLDIMFPISVYGEFASIDARPLNGTRITVDWSVNGKTVTMKLGGDISSGVVLTVLCKAPSRLLNLTDINTLHVALPIVFQTNYNITHIKARFVFPEEVSSLSSSSPQGIFVFSKRTAGAGTGVYELNSTRGLNFTILDLRFKVKNIPWLLAPTLTRKVSINGPNSIVVEDSYTLLYEGVKEMDYWAPPTIPNFRVVEVRDKFGKLTYDKIKEKWVLRYFVKPRSRFEVTVVYQTKLNMTNGELSFDITHGLVTLVDRYTCEIVLPSGSSFREVDPKPDESLYEPPTIKYLLDNAVPDSGYVVTLKADIATAGTYINTASMAVLILIIIIVALTGYMAYVKPAEKEERMERRGDVAQLVEALSAKYTAMKELSKIEEEYAAKKIRRSIYIQKRRALRRELTRLEAEIKDLLRRVRYGTQVTKIIKKLDEYEALLRTSQAALKELNKDYAAKKIRRETYIRLYNQRVKDIDRIFARIDALLRELEEQSR